MLLILRVTYHLQLAGIIGTQDVKYTNLLHRSLILAVNVYAVDKRMFTSAMFQKQI